MTTPRLSQEATDWLVQSLVHVAWIDKSISPIEVALIERIMTVAFWDDDATQEIRRMLDGRSSCPPLKLPPPALSYEGKVKVFQDVVELVFCDGVLDRREQDLVMKVANALSLHLSDMQQIWSRAKRHHDLQG